MSTDLYKVGGVFCLFVILRKTRFKEVFEEERLKQNARATCKYSLKAYSSAVRNPKCLLHEALSSGPKSTEVNESFSSKFSEFWIMTSKISASKS